MQFKRCRFNRKHDCHEEGLRYLMHLYIIAQYLNLQAPGEDRFFKLGRDLLEQGHRVTIFTGADGVGFELERKEIGLYNDKGMTMVVLNAPYEQKMSNLQKLKSYLKFSRMVDRQARLLPKPDLLLVSTPPLSAAIPALKLKKFFDTPLILEVRELWPDAPIQRGTLKNRLLIKWARKQEENVYLKADRIVASGAGIAESVKGVITERNKVYTIPDGLDDQEMQDGYRKALENLVSTDVKSRSF